MFKPGDEVVCVDDGPMLTPRRKSVAGPSGLVAGKSYTIQKVRPNFSDPSVVMVELVGVSHGCNLFATPGYAAYRFRRVHKRNDRLSIESFMTMPGGFEEPRRPAKTKEKTQ